MKINWKRLFFILVGLNIAVVGLIILFALLPASNDSLEKSDKVEESVKFTIETNKADLNEIINHYIEKEGLKGAIDYKVLLGDEVELYGIIPVFTEEIEMKLTFEPEALDNGDLILKQKSISLGRLQLPVSYVLKFVRDNYNLPEWVNIQPNDELVYVSLQKMKLKSDLKVRVNKFDLKRDDIVFTLMVPTK